MKSEPYQYKTHCPINFALETFGDRWSLLIIRDMIFLHKRHFGEFINSREEISTNILADRLEKLAARGLINKEPDPENRSKFIYSPTLKGLDLIPIMLEINLWSDKYDSQTDVPRSVIMKIKKNKDKYIKELRGAF